MSPFGMENPYAAAESLKAEEEIEPNIAIDRVQEGERGILQRLQGKAKKVALAMAFMTALSIAGMVKSAGAFEGPGKAANATEQQQEQVNQKAVDFLIQLYNLPDNPRAANPAQNKIMQMRAAQVMVQEYALKRTGEQSGNVTPDMVKAALQELSGALGPFVDKTVGFENMSKVYSAPGIQAVQEMMAQYQI